MEITYTQLQGSWSAWNYLNPVDLPLSSPWRQYTFVLNANLLTKLYVGQTVVSFTNTSVLNGTFSPQFKIGALVYKEVNGSNCYTTEGPNRQLIGCLIIDNNNNLLELQNSNLNIINTGIIYLDVISNSGEIEAINCFKKSVWDLQCKFAKCVLKYLQGLYYGINNCGILEELKDKKRILEILNCYDTRDIINNTTDYNDITYYEIKELLNC